MRLFIVNLIAVGLLTFTAGTASAVTLTLGAPGGLPQTVAVGDQITVTMTIDTEATVGITLLSIAVLFGSELSYNQAASSSNNGSGYILYDAGAKNGGNYLSAAGTCGGGYGSPTAGAGCQLSLEGQVNADYVGDFENGTGAGNVGVALMATLVFDVVAPVADSGLTPLIVLSQTSSGNVIGVVPAGSSTTGTLVGGFYVTDGVGIVVPEPGLASLALAAILTVGGLRTRERRRR